jgi:hypothetical protein
MLLFIGTCDKQIGHVDTPSVERLMVIEVTAVMKFCAYGSSVVSVVGPITKQIRTFFAYFMTYSCN